DRRSGEGGARDGHRHDPVGADHQRAAPVTATRSRVLAIGAPLLALGACAGPPAPPPLVALDGRTCLAETSLAGAQQVTLNPDQPVVAKVTLDGSSPCWTRTPGTGTPYAVFKLPDAKEPYLVGITSTPIGQGLFPPFVYVLDADG